MNTPIYTYLYIYMYICIQPIPSPISHSLFQTCIGRREIPNAILCRCPVLLEWIIQKDGLRHGCVSAVFFL